MDMRDATIINAQLGKVPPLATVETDEDRRVVAIRLGELRVRYNRRVYYAGLAERAQIQQDARAALGLEPAPAPAVEGE